MSTDSMDTTLEVSDEAAARSEETAIVVPEALSDLQPKMRVKGTVKRLELYGAFVDLGIDGTALIHISKLGGDQVNRVSDVLSEGDEIVAYVEKVDPERQQVMLTLVEPVAVDWSELQTGQVFTGKVARLENFGAFVDIGAEREGLVHISEMSHEYVRQPGEVVSVGDTVQVQVLGYNRRKKRIDLSMKALMEKTQPEVTYSKAEAVAEIEEEDEFEESVTAMEIAMRRALGNETVSEVKAENRSGSKGRKNRRRSNRSDQEDLLERTLQFQGEN